MANRQLALTQRQIEAICKGAARAGMCPEININGTWVRLIPNVQTAIAAPVVSREQELDDELDRFRAKHGYS
ncbi:hypothetical protein [Rhizobium phage RHEph27]|uniref:Uncharacterized protein n=1 Tax=Rhizobium phage RHph_TM34 TaxID=2509556 RepID=A0A7S5R0S6_9CAUD|nr:hypothetical protein EVB35_006 [Rhizobium phage RHph_TM34]QXV74961.1 hypothetical protein [Rhizobium phage RHEph27]